MCVCGGGGGGGGGAVGVRKEGGGWVGIKRGLVIWRPFLTCISTALTTHCYMPNTIILKARLQNTRPTVLHLIE